MEDKEQKKKSQGKFGPKGFLALAVAALVVIAVIVTVAGGDSETEIPVEKINTPYIDLLLPQELAQSITSDESTYDAVYTRGFYLNYGGEEVSLWRIDFGDPNAGDWVGMLKTDAGDIPVTMTGFAISDEELDALGEEGTQLYGACMQAYTVMLEGIMADSRFTAERPLAVGEDTVMKLMHWNVTLPDTMRISENSGDGSYEAVFSGDIVGQIVPLYRVCIGEPQAASLIGYFELDGVKQPVTVESFALEEREDWLEDDYAAADRMMDTINDVIDVIVQSKEFSAEVE